MARLYGNRLINSVHYKYNHCNWWLTNSKARARGGYGNFFRNSGGNRVFMIGLFAMIGEWIEYGIILNAIRLLTR